MNHQQIIPFEPKDVLMQQSRVINNRYLICLTKVKQEPEPAPTKNWLTVNFVLGPGFQFDEPTVEELIWKALQEFGYQVSRPKLWQENYAECRFKHDNPGVRFYLSFSLLPINAVRVLQSEALPQREFKFWKERMWSPGNVVLNLTTKSPD